MSSRSFRRFRLGFDACAVGASLAALAIAAGPARANESACYSIRDSDRKNMCLAQAKRQESYCHAIRAADDKHMCLAVVRNRRSECYSIRANDLKNMCLAQVRVRPA